MLFRQVTAIHHDGFASDVLRDIGSEKSDNAGDLGGGREASQRNRRA